MELMHLLQQTSQLFKDSKINTFRLDAEILLGKALNKSRTELYISRDKVNEDQLSICNELIDRRLQGEPVAYLVGQKDFYKYTFNLNHKVLIPRPETELLLEQALHWIKENPRDNYNVLDLGCGSGCIGLSILKEHPNAQCASVDISDEAIDCTIENAKKLGVVDRMFPIYEFAEVLRLDHFVDAGMLFEGEFDLVVSNPPYITPGDNNVSPEVLHFEPNEALFCLNNGFEKIQNWTNKAYELLKPKGFWGFEIGHNQSAKAYDMLTTHGGFEDIKLFKDLAGHDRTMTAIKKVNL